MNNQKAGLKMSLLMGLMMSFSLSLIGLLCSGRFTLSGFLLNFLTSFVISFLLGMILPVRKIARKAAGAFPPGSLKGRAVEAGMAARLGLVPAGLPMRSSFDRGADYIAALGLLAGTAERIARDIHTRFAE